MSRKVIAITIGVAALGIGIGVIIGYFSHPGNFESNQESASSTSDSYFRDLDPAKVNTFVENVNANKIRNNLMYFAEKPHMATSPRDEELANYIRDQWESQIDEAYLTPYEIMHGFLSEDANKPNRVTVVDPTTYEISFELRKSEIVYPEYMKDPETIVPYYSAFGPPGDVQGKLVYANYGSEQDYLELIKLGVEVNGSIILVKYGGGVGRGGKAVNGQKFGVKGVLIYSDPIDYVVEGEIGYPNDFSLPGTGVQRGSTLAEFGDPSTPNYPSTEYAYRLPIDEIEVFPPLPLQPIAYNDAAALLGDLGGPIAPDEWKTRLNISELHVGPGFAPNDYREVHLEAFNIYKTTTSYNVIGVIRGSEEPDKYVMYGNHRDAWVYGAVDPSSGTACMMEIVRIYGEMITEGWRPRRSILFGSWGSEEFGLIGSTEWAEDNLFLLTDRAVSYINVDIAVFGSDAFFARASPLMTQLFYDAADIPDAQDPNKTLKDLWLEVFPNEANTNPLIGRLYSSSDYAYFYQIIGITSADLSYRGNPSEPRNQISPYPTYHTGYDTFDYVDRFVDPGFFAHQAVARIAGNALLRIADSLILPFSVSHFADFVKSQVDATEQQYGVEMTANGISLDYLKDAGSQLKVAANEFETFIEKTLDRKNLQEVVAVNDRLLSIDRYFIEPRGLPGQPFMKHVSGSPGNLDDSSGSFPGIMDTMFEARQNSSLENWQHVAQQVALATYKIHSAVNLLKLDLSIPK